MPAAPRLFMHGGGNTEHFGSLYIKIYTHPRKCNPSPLNICGGRKPSPRGNSPARGGNVGAADKRGPSSGEKGAERSEADEVSENNQQFEIRGGFYVTRNH